MNSPFPGMDPYIEDPAHWPDFHARFINAAAESLADALPEHYTVRIDERVNLIELDESAAKLIRPDLSILKSPAPATHGGSEIATLEPVTVPLPIEEELRQTSIQILHLPDQRLVTAIELLSPANKQGAGRADYLAKRKSILSADVHLVELDLLLGGSRLPLGAPLPHGDYFALISRSDRRPYCDVYAWGLRDPLPVIPVPLHKGDQDAGLNLGAVFATTYQRGRYQRVINYKLAPNAPMAASDRTWATEIGHAAHS